MTTDQKMETPNAQEGSNKTGFFGRLFQKLDSKMKAKAEESAPCCCCEEDASKDEKPADKCCNS